MNNREYFFNRAFEEANKSLKLGEIPVGAVIVKDGIIISTGYNEKESQNCALCHAELTAIKKASEVLNNWRLIDCDIYVTLEPCEMCASAIKQARISNIYSALSNDDENIHNNVLNILKKDKSNPEVNLYNDQCVDLGRNILKEFFISTRKH